MPRALTAHHAPSWPRKRISEAVGVALLMVALYLAASIVSYHDSDPSFNVSGARHVRNFGGRTGAYLADMLLQTLGLVSLFIVATIAAWGWRLFAHKRPPLLIGMRLIAFILSLLLLALLFSFPPAPGFWPFGSGLGGAVGLRIMHYLRHRHLFSNLLIPVIFLLLGGSLPAAWGLSWGEWKQSWRKLGRNCRHLWRQVAAVALEESDAPALDLPAAPPSAPKETTHEETPWFVRLWRGKPALDAPRPAPAKRRRASSSSSETEEEPPQAMASIVMPFMKKDAKKPPVKMPNAPAPAETDDAFALPGMGLLAEARHGRKQTVSEAQLAQTTRMLETVLKDFGVNGSITHIRPGPVVTLYELEPSPGTKSSRVIGLADDIARSMSAVSARIATIPGRNVIGIEMPNQTRETVYLRELLEEDAFYGSNAHLPLALGKDIGGAPVIVDLARMPHLLVAGTTGSGKSVAINTMITSLLYKLTPQQCKFIMIDPKMLELSIYDDIPHLLSPVVTEPGKAVVALKWTVKEMEDRYRKMSSLAVRNIDGYNKRIEEALAKGETLSRSVQTGFNPDTGAPVFEEVKLEMSKLPFIVVVVDEMADLMLVAGKEIESSIQRLAQMARAAGIHIIMATQRPSVDVITGVIKANFPTRISFQVTSRIDSRTILGEQGAEQLLGQGDMLYMAGGGRITRVHGPFVSDKEVEQIVAHLKRQGAPAYVEDVTREPEEGFPGEGEAEEGDDGAIYHQAKAIVLRDKKASTSYLQRTLKLGYNRAARLIDRMEEEGIVGPANHVGKREVLG